MTSESMPSVRVRKSRLDPSVNLAEALASKVFGQPTAVDSIVPYIQMYKARLAPGGRPVGVFLLLGPTGTGKTKTVEALAEVLHGGEKNLLKIDCGEFQMEHEVARLIGAPPGYLGHRETQPMITQQKLHAAISEHCNLSIVLFDEIEKAAPSLSRLLLGMLDKAVLHLGDNTAVDFENSLIFMTSNLGSRSMLREISPDIGFRASASAPKKDLARKLERIGVNAVRRRFSPEFVNRIDAVITYKPLDTNSLEAILNHHIDEFQNHVCKRLEANSFRIHVSESSRQFLLKKGTSEEHGARELERTLHRHLIQPVAAMVACGEIEPGSKVRIDYCESLQGLRIHADFEFEASRAKGRRFVSQARGTGQQRFPNEKIVRDSLRLTA